MSKRKHTPSLFICETTLQNNLEKVNKEITSFTNRASSYGYLVSPYSQSRESLTFPRVWIMTFKTHANSPMKTARPNNPL